MDFPGQSALIVAGYGWQSGSWPCAGVRGGEAGLLPSDLMRDINPHLAFSVSFLTSPKEYPLYARPRKQWRLARREEVSKNVNK